MERSDAELIAAARDGDREAFSLLVDAHKDPLVSYLARLVGNRERAEDLAQESFLRFYQNLDRYDERGQLRAYLFRVATTLLRSEERRERRFRLLSPWLVTTNGHAPAAPERLLEDEIRRQVTQAVATRPLRFRVPLVLHEIEGWPYAEIARQLGCGEGTVKSRIFRGRQRLKERLKPYWNGSAR